jgi:hypothetical protein
VALRRGEIEKIRAYRRPEAKAGRVWCTTCKQYKPESAFRWNAPRNNWDRSCRPCKVEAQRRHLDSAAPASEEILRIKRSKHAAYMREWSAKNRDLQRMKVTLRNWGLTQVQYLAMFEAQDHKCAICGAQARAMRALAIDHCHDTGRIRGLLCQDCNMGMGQFADSPDLLEAAARYLRDGGVVHDENLRIPETSPHLKRSRERDTKRSRRRTGETEGALMATNDSGLTDEVHVVLTPDAPAEAAEPHTDDGDGDGETGTPIPDLTAI